MNLPSEQLRKDFTLDIALDQPLKPSEMTDVLIEVLGQVNCYFESIAGKKVFVYKRADGVNEILLCAAVTYLGGNGQHPVFKKRIQLQKRFKDIYNEVKEDDTYNVRFIGIYHYKGNIVFVDFVKDTYLKKKMNNSAAHVYINDLYQAMGKGIFEKEDNLGNKIISISCEKFKAYLNNSLSAKNELFQLFDRFNKNFFRDQWITAEEAITEMHDNNWPQWRQTEWAGWYIEYKFDDYLNQNDLTDKIQYVGSSHKGADEIDFDLWFEQDNLYGDLKASDASKTITPGNDQETFRECIDKYGKFWYIIYEHDTIKDSDKDYEATKFRSNYLMRNGGWRKDKPFDEMSYSSRMKNQVKFVGMTIIELNKINFKEVLVDFTQGQQPDGKPRKLKYSINKKDIDNYVVYRYRK